MALDPGKDKINKKNETIVNQTRMRKRTESKISMSVKDWEPENYYSKDFDRDQLREEVGNYPSLQFHVFPIFSKSNS